MIHLAKDDGTNDPACNPTSVTPQIAVADRGLVDCGDCLALPEHHRIHVRKSWPLSFDRHLDGTLHAEHRFDSPPLRAGDVLVLREWSPDTAEYTGRVLRRRITDVQRSPLWGIRDRYAVLSLDAAVSLDQDQPVTDHELAELVRRHGGSL